MIRLLKHPIVITAGIVVLFISVLSIFGSLMLGDSRGCEGDSEAANYVRSLSQERLGRLYRDMEELHDKVGEQSYEYSPGGGGLPKQFLDLEVAKVSLIDSTIMVEGCFDSYLYLYFEGIENDEKKGILMQYGEHEIGTEVVWPK